MYLSTKRTIFRKLTLTNAIVQNFAKNVVRKWHKGIDGHLRKFLPKSLSFLQF